jgi:hypothetical protein
MSVSAKARSTPPAQEHPRTPAARRRMDRLSLRIPHCRNSTGAECGGCVLTGARSLLMKPDRRWPMPTWRVRDWRLQIVAIRDGSSPCSTTIPDILFL